MISALQTLADQMSVAIENTRLLDELRSSLRETRTLNQRYTQESWSGSAKKATTSGYQFDLSQISPYTRDLPEEIRTQLQAGRAIPVTNRQLKISTEESNGKTGQHSDGNRDGNRSILIAPLILYDRLIGVLGVEEDNPNHKWSSEEIALLEAISNQVSLTLDNARLVEETQLRSEQIRLLQEITAEAASHVKLNELLEAVTQRLLTGYNLSQCGIAMLDTVPGSGDEPGDERQSSGRQPAKTSTMLAYTSAPGMPGPNLKGSKIPIDEDGLAKKVLDTHKAIVVHDKPHPTMLMAPLLTRGESFGMITMEITDPERQFNEDDLRLLEQIGLQISAAIEVARNFEQTANRAEYERLIGDMTSRIRETLDVETMVKTAVKEVQQALKLPEVVIRLGLPTKRESAPDSTESGLTTPLTGEIE
jgi:GAF domain-containing protein